MPLLPFTAEKRLLSLEEEGGFLKVMRSLLSEPEITSGSISLKLTSRAETRWGYRYLTEKYDV